MRGSNSAGSSNSTGPSKGAVREIHSSVEFSPTTKKPDSSKGSNQSGDDSAFSGLKAPPKRRPTALPSGAHIQRRPLSAAQQVNQGSTTPQGTRLPRDRSHIGISSPTTDRTEVVRPLRFERRADPSPAPFRPPRANRRKIVPAALMAHEGGSAKQRTAPLSGSITSIGSGTPLKEKTTVKATVTPTASGLPTGQSTSVVRRVGKEGSVATATTTVASRSPAHVSAERQLVESRLNQYITACEQDGEPVNVEWVNLVQQVLREPSELKQESATEASGTQSKLAVSRMAKTVKPSSTSSTKPSALQQKKSASAISAEEYRAVEDTLELMAAFCRRRHSALKFKKEVIFQKRNDVAAAVEAFRQTHQQAMTAVGGHHPLSADAQDYTRRNMSSEQWESMKTNAERLTSGLQALQQSEVQLLLRLQDYAKEVRKPLGSSEAPDAAVSAAGRKEENYFTALSEFVSQQEREVALQLKGVQETVGHILRLSDLISVEDEGILDTPLFFRVQHVQEGAGRAASQPKPSGSTAVSGGKQLPLPHHSSSAQGPLSSSVASSGRPGSALFTVQMTTRENSVTSPRETCSERVTLVLGGKERSSPRISSPSVREPNNGRRGSSASLVANKRRSSSTSNRQTTTSSNTRTVKRYPTSVSVEPVRSSQSSVFLSPSSSLSKAQLEQAISVWFSISTLLESRLLSTTVVDRSQHITAVESPKDKSPDISTTTVVRSPSSAAGKKGTSVSFKPSHHSTSAGGLKSASGRHDTSSTPLGSYRESSVRDGGSSRRVATTTTSPTTVVKMKERQQHVSPTSSLMGSARSTKRKSTTVTATSASQSAATASATAPNKGGHPHLSPAEALAAEKIAACWRTHKAKASLQVQLLERKAAMAAKQAVQVRLRAGACIGRWLRQQLFRRRVESMATAKGQAAKEGKKSTPLKAQASDASPSGPASAGSRCDSHKTARDRFLRTKEKRRALNASMSIDTSMSDSSVLTNGADGPSDISLHGGEGCSVPPLPLLDNGISTINITNYNKDSESFELQVIHRLLRAPPHLVFLLSVLTFKNPHFPPMGYAAMKDKSTPSFSTLVEKVTRSRNTAPAAFSEANTVVDRSLDGSCVLPFSALERLQPPTFVSNSSSASHSSTTSEEGSAPSVPWPKVNTSYVRPHELREPKPVNKGFRRPFEKWGAANALVRRLFTMAAIYSWKLIFSHTPLDDYKQCQLKTSEEKAARLDRVDQRNRMILACYCVHSEREWLREASKDISFIGQIWNPKKSLDPNDPDLHRHCKETFDFVEDFLYQCFPTVTVLEEVPSFLLAAGLFFLLRESFHYSEVVSASSLQSLGYDYFVKPSEALRCSRGGGSDTETSQKLSGWSQTVQQRFELCSLLDRMVELEKSERATQDGKASKVLTSATLPKVDSSMDPSAVTRQLLHVARGSSITDELLGKVALHSTPTHIYRPTAKPAASARGFSDELIADDASECKLKLLGVPVAVVSTRIFFFQDYEESLFAHVARWVQHTTSQSSSECGRDKAREPSLNYVVVYPKRYLVHLAESLANILFGVHVELDVCEELD